MVSEATAKILQEFETKFHSEVYEWILSKIPEKECLEILDMSLDRCIFSANLASKLKAKRLVSAIREPDLMPISVFANAIQVKLSPENNFSALDELGRFDVIVLREMLHETGEEMEKFFEKLKHNLKLDSPTPGKIVILTRPKNPPVPLPDGGLDLWRKTAPTREAILLNAANSGYVHESYAVSCPISIPKFAWGDFLKGRFLACLRNNKKCSDKDIKEFIAERPGTNLHFEEKILIFVLSPAT